MPAWPAPLARRAARTRRRAVLATLAAATGALLLMIGPAAGADAKTLSCGNDGIYLNIRATGLTCAQARATLVRRPSFSLQWHCVYNKTDVCRLGRKTITYHYI